MSIKKAMDQGLDGNGQEPRKDVDRKRYQGADLQGHVPGSHQAEFKEQQSREMEEEDKSLNYPDNLEEAGGNL